MSAASFLNTIDAARIRICAKADFACSERYVLAPRPILIVSRTPAFAAISLVQICSMVQINAWSPITS